MVYATQFCFAINFFTESNDKFAYYFIHKLFSKNQIVHGAYVKPSHSYNNDIFGAGVPTMAQHIWLHQWVSNLLH